MGKLLLRFFGVIGRWHKTALACLFGPVLVALVYWVLHWAVLWVNNWLLYRLPA